MQILATPPLELNSPAERLELELLYETNPLELLFARNVMTTIAVAGVVAAVAIPAYSDYTVRAEVNDIFNEISAVQALLADFHADQGRFPDQQEFSVLMDVALIESEAIAALNFDPVSQQLSVTLAEPSQVYGDNIVLSAELIDGVIEWQCSTDSDQPKLYPMMCR